MFCTLPPRSNNLRGYAIQTKFFSKSTLYTNEFISRENAVSVCTAKFVPVDDSAETSQAAWRIFSFPPGIKWNTQSIYSPFLGLGRSKFTYANWWGLSETRSSLISIFVYIYKNKTLNYTDFFLSGKFYAMFSWVSKSTLAWSPDILVSKLFVNVVDLSLYCCLCFVNPYR